IELDFHGRCNGELPFRSGSYMQQCPELRLQHFQLWLRVSLSFSVLPWIEYNRLWREPPDDWKEAAQVFLKVDPVPFPLVLQVTVGEVHNELELLGIIHISPHSSRFYSISDLLTRQVA